MSARKRSDEGSDADSSNDEQVAPAAAESGRPRRAVKRPDFYVEPPAAKKQRATRSSTRVAEEKGSKQTEARDREEEGGEEEEEDSEFEVEEIVNQRVFRKRIQYEVRWRGYDSSENTWEPAENLQDCAALDKFLASAVPYSLPPVSPDDDRIPDLSIQTLDPEWDAASLISK